MYKETPVADQIVWQSDEGDDMNTALFRPLPQKGEFSLATSHLCGCCSLWIISRKGVYAAHWWESIAFAPDDAWKLTPAETDEDIFQRTVTDHIRNGHVSSNGDIMHEKLVADNIEDSLIKAYLVHPSHPCEEHYAEQYRAYWAQIINTVKDIIPTLKEDNRWQEITYDPLDPEDDMLHETSRGRILFKFDAHHGSRRGPA